MGEITSLPPPSTPAAGHFLSFSYQKETGTTVLDDVASMPDMTSFGVSKANGI